jgi:exosortase
VGDATDCVRLSGVTRDLRFAALVALLLAVSPATGSARWWLSALLGIAGGAVVLALRVWRRRREGGRSAPARDASPAGTPAARPEPLVVAALVGLGLVFAPTFAWLFGEYTEAVWRNVHGVFVPLFAFLLARSALRRDPTPSRREASPWGLPLIAAGLAAAVLDAGVRSGHLAAIGLLLCVPGVSLVFLGPRRTRLLAGPLALCVFALPAPRALEDPLGLTQATAVLADVVVDALGLPVLRHGTLFATRNGPINVSQNCSGLSTLHAAAALAFVLAYTARGTARRILIPLLVYPITAGGNALRLVGLLAATDRWGVGFLNTPLHGFSGLAVLWSVLACLWLCADHRGLREALS